MAGIGPATSPLPRECSTTEPHGRLILRPQSWSGRRDSNSRHSVWKTEALPTELHPRILLTSAYRLKLTFSHYYYCTIGVLQTLVEGEGFEPSYSERTDLQSVAFNHSATPPNRTHDYAENLTDCQIV